MPWTLLATNNTSSQASTFWYMASTISSTPRFVPFSPASAWEAGMDSSTLGVEISVALRMSVWGAADFSAPT